MKESVKIYNLQDKLEYLEEVAILEYEEWASNKEENKHTRIERKKEFDSLVFNNVCKERI